MRWFWFYPITFVVLWFTTPLGNEITGQFTTPETTHTSRDLAMKACLDYGAARVKADLQLPNPETIQEIRARHAAEDNDAPYVERSTYKNTDGEYLILDVFCRRQPRTRLFGLIKWNEARPMVNWVERPDQECIKQWGSCSHTPHFNDEIPLTTVDSNDFVVKHFSYPHAS